MKQLTVKMIRYGKQVCHARFVFVEYGKADEIIDEQIKPELCVRLYRDGYCDESGTPTYTISKRAMEYMVDTLASRF